MFVNHWDVCLSSESCAKVLNKRGISVHFCIDNDGTIYQMVDMNHAAWHAGSRKGNLASVGVEISNAYYPKYQDWYKRNGFGERSLVEGATVHGRTLDPFLDFYPVQIEALKALWEACHNALEIPYKCPLDKEGNTLTKVSTSAAAARFKGFVSHYHLTGRKIDCANLDINAILKDLK
jgi:N-acetyl-anhydromuramyl-L-alanine amidase AmpD